MELGIAARLGRFFARLVGRPASSTPPDSGDLADNLTVARSEAADALARADYALAVARDMSLPTRMLAFMSWLELHAPAEGPRISVILATRDRPESLAGAIDSIRSQRYEEWELIVVDDGDTDSVARTLAGSEDERILVVDGPRRGLSAARNAGLDRASGVVVCYADDDNIMHPSWLHAVSEVFSKRDDVDIAYGVAIAEHRIPGDLTEYGWWPSFWQLPWSRAKLLEENITDAGAIAHRRELGGARFDEDLRTGEDWDLLLRLTADRDALAVPAVSHAYSMDGADRMSDDPAHRAGLEKIRRRHAAP